MTVPSPFVLTPDQRLWLLGADPDSGDLPEEAAAWLAAECANLGLVLPAPKPGAWKLSPDGRLARHRLLALLRG